MAFIGGVKFGRVPGMIDKKSVSPLCINLNNQPKYCLPGKI